MKLRNSVVMITGATAGIGLATAELLAQQGCHLILTGRRLERLQDIAAKLSHEHEIRVTPLCFDIRQYESCKGALDNIAGPIDILINNAGLALGIEKMQDAHISDWDVMIDTNVKGLLYLTRLVLPRMLQSKSGHIVNLGSVAGRTVYPGGGIYCATKFAVRALSEGLRMDLIGTSIRVTNIEPGLVETEFSQVRLKDAEKAKAVYAGMQPLKPVDIAETIVWCLERPSHVNIQELVIFPTDQAAVGQVHRSSAKLT